MLDNPFVSLGAAYLLVLFFVLLGTSQTGFYRSRSPTTKPFGLVASMILAALILGALVLFSVVSSRL